MVNIRVLILLACVSATFVSGCRASGGLRNEPSHTAEAQSEATKAASASESAPSPEDTVPCAGDPQSCPPEQGSCPDCLVQQPSTTSGDCRFEEFIIRERQSFPALDGCNRCGCRDGILSCTELGCLDQARPKGCPIGPFVLPFGRIIVLADGCNSCQCESEATLNCTRHECEKNNPD